jgi:DNA repair protein RecO (recombination protein O)
MPVLESEAIILRSFPLGEGDRLVSFFSRTHGVSRGVAGGAQRPKTRFGATLEPLSYIRIWFYERESRPLARINQTELIESFLDVQKDYAAGVALAVLSDVTEAVLGEQEVAEANFRLLLATARAIKAGANLFLALAYFSLWTVRLGGWLPRLDRCAHCGAAITGNAYASPTVGFLCADCRIPGQRQISQGALESARRMLGERLENMAKEAPVSGGVKELRDYMLDVIEDHLERPLQSRKMLAGSVEIS